MKYKKHEYEIKFHHPSQDWGDTKGLFSICSAAGDTGKYYRTHEEANKAAKEKIDEFLVGVPQNEKEWIEAIEDCMVRTGYEECHIDELMALEVLKKAKIHFPHNANIDHNNTTNE